MTGLNRRSLLLGGAALGAAGGLAGIADLASHAGRRPSTSGSGLRIGYLPITDAAPLLVAHGSGLFDRAEVEVPRPVLFRSWASLAEAFLSRQVDVVHLLMPFAVQLRYALGAQVRILAWNHTNGSSLTVRRDITTLDGLAGRKVAIPYWWSIHNIALQQMLRKTGATSAAHRGFDRGQSRERASMMRALARALSNETGEDDSEAGGRGPSDRR